MREERLRAQPGDMTRRRDLAVALAAHADMLADIGRRSAACDARRRGLVLLDGLTKGGDLSDRDRRTEYAKLAGAGRGSCR